MSEQVDLFVFKEVEGFAFMKCEFCEEDILITTDKFTYCRNVRNNKHFSKHVFRLEKDDSELGFNRVLYIPVSMVNTRTIKDLEKEQVTKIP